MRSGCAIGDEQQQQPRRCAAHHSHEHEGVKKEEKVSEPEQGARRRTLTTLTTFPIDTPNHEHGRYDDDEDIDEEAPTGDTNIAATFEPRGGGGAYCCLDLNILLNTKRVGVAFALGSTSSDQSRDALADIYICPNIVLSQDHAGT